LSGFAELLYANVEQDAGARFFRWAVVRDDHFLLPDLREFSFDGGLKLFPLSDGILIEKPAGM